MKIADAIRTRHLLTFNYHDHYRVVEPHTYGKDQKGHTALRAYQTGGTSGSGRIPDFRIFHEAEITALSVSAQTFAGHRPGYVRGDPFFATIHAQL
jgi:hypothetical protein